MVQLEFAIFVAQWFVVSLADTEAVKCLDALFDELNSVKCCQFCEDLAELGIFIHHDVVKESRIDAGPAKHEGFPNVICGTLGIKRAPENCVTSSTICRTGLPFKYIISIYTRALNRTCSWPIETRKRTGALWIRLQGSHRETMSLKLSKVCASTNRVSARLSRLNSFLADVCANWRCIFSNCAVE